MLLFSIECAKNYEYWCQFLQVIEDKTDDIFETRGCEVVHKVSFSCAKSVNNVKIRSP